MAAEVSPFCMPNEEAHPPCMAADEDVSPPGLSDASPPCMAADEDASPPGLSDEASPPCMAADEASPFCMPNEEAHPPCMAADEDVSPPGLSDASPPCNLPEEICAAGPPCMAAEVSPFCMAVDEVSPPCMAVAGVPLFISRLYAERRSILPGFIESEAASILRSTSLLESLLSASSQHLALSAALYSTNGCLASFQQPQSYLAPLSNLDSAIITALIFFFWQSPPL